MVIREGSVEKISLQRKTSLGRIGDDVSVWCQINQGGDEVVETQLERVPHLVKWFVDIVYPSAAIRDS